MELIIDHGNGMGTGTELTVLATRDPDQSTIDLADEDVLEAWHVFKSFVTSGMVLPTPNLKKDYVQPIITSRPQLRIVAEIRTATWSDGEANVYVWYTTRKLDEEARRILIGGT